MAVDGADNSAFARYTPFESFGADSGKAHSGVDPGSRAARSVAGSDPPLAVDDANPSAVAWNRRLQGFGTPSLYARSSV